MTLEIRELVIEARVIDDAGVGGISPMPQTMGDGELAQWVELVTRQVLDVLHEQWERQS